MFAHMHPKTQRQTLSANVQWINIYMSHHKHGNLRFSISNNCIHACIKLPPQSNNCFNCHPFISNVYANNNPQHHKLKEMQTKMWLRLTTQFIHNDSVEVHFILYWRDSGNIQPLLLATTLFLSFVKVIVQRLSHLYSLNLYFFCFVLEVKEYNVLLSTLKPLIYKLHMMCNPTLIIRNRNGCVMFYDYVSSYIISFE